MHPKPKTLLKLVLKLTIFALWKWRGLVFGLGIFENNFCFGAQTFWSLLHHFYTSKSFRWHTNNFLNHSKWTRNEENIEFKNKKGFNVFFSSLNDLALFLLFFLVVILFLDFKRNYKPSIDAPMAMKKIQD